MQKVIDPSSDTTLLDIRAIRHVRLIRESKNAPGDSQKVKHR